MEDPILHDLQYNPDSPTNSVSEESFIEEFDNRFTNKSKIGNSCWFGRLAISFFCDTPDISIICYFDESESCEVFGYHNGDEVFEMEFTDTQMKSFDQSNLDALFNILELKLN